MEISYEGGQGSRALLLVSGHPLQNWKSKVEIWDVGLAVVHAWRVSKWQLSCHLLHMASGGFCPPGGNQVAMLEAWSGPFLVGWRPGELRLVAPQSPQPNHSTRTSSLRQPHRGARFLEAPGAAAAQIRGTAKGQRVGAGVGWRHATLDDANGDTVLCNYPSH